MSSHEEDVDNVRCLPDQVQDKRSGILERVEQKTILQKKTSLENLNAEFYEIGQCLQEKIRSALTELMEFARGSKRETKRVADHLRTPEGISQLSQHDAEMLVRNSDDCFHGYLVGITRIISGLLALEDRRKQETHRLLSQFYNQHSNCSYISSGDLSGFLSDSLEKMNSLFLANMEAYVKLGTSLKVDLLMCHQRLRLQLGESLEVWAELQAEQYVGRVKHRLELCLKQCSEKYTQICRALSVHWKNGVCILRQSRSSLWSGSFTGTATLDFGESLKDIEDSLAMLGGSFSRYSEDFRDALETTEKEYLQIVADVQLEVGALQTFTKGSASLTHHCEELHTRLHHHRACLDSWFNISELMFTSWMKREADHLLIIKEFLSDFKAFRETQEDDLEAHKIAFIDQMTRMVHFHTAVIQEKECRLDIILQRLRRESSVEGLQAAHTASMQKLEEIRALYESFYNQRVSTIRGYPQSTSVILETSRQTFSAYLEKTTKDFVHRLGTSTIPVGVSELSQPVPVSKMEDEDDIYELDRHPTELETLLWNWSIPCLKDGVAEEILHWALHSLVGWVDASLATVESVSQSMIKESGEELGLRLQLHQLRPKRIRESIYDIRAAELSDHSNRVAEHEAAVLFKLNEGVDFVTRTLDVEMARLKESFERTKLEVVHVIRVRGLQDLQGKFHRAVEKYTELVHDSLVEARTVLKDLTDTLVHSTRSIQAALRPFMDGGNFSVKEITVYQSRMNILVERIFKSSSSSSNKLDNLQLRRTDQARDLLSKMDDIFKTHEEDLTFLDSLAQTSSSLRVAIKSETYRTQKTHSDLCTGIQFLRSNIATSTGSSDTCTEVSYREECLRQARTLSGLLRAHAKYLAAQLPQSGVPRVSSTRPAKKSLSLIRSTAVSWSQKRSNQVDGGMKAAGKTVVYRANQHRGMPPGISASSTHEDNVDQDSDYAASESGISCNLSPATKLTNRSTASNRQERYLLVPEVPVDRDDFLSVLQRRLRQTLVDLLSQAEAYYRQKGLRPPTRLASIPESFDACAEKLLVQVQQHLTVIASFHSTSVQEFRNIIESYCEAVGELVPRLLDSVFHEATADIEGCYKAVDSQLSKDVGAIDTELASICKDLRPVLILSPDGAERLAHLKRKLGHAEIQLRTVKAETSTQLSKLHREQVERFCDDLHRVFCETMLLLDEVIYVNDITPTENPPVTSTNDYVRSKHEGESMQPVPHNGQGPDQKADSSFEVLSGVFVWTRLGPSVLTSTAVGKITTTRCGSLHRLVDQHRRTLIQALESNSQQRLNAVSDSLVLKLENSARSVDSLSSTINRLSNSASQPFDNWTVPIA